MRDCDSLRLFKCLSLSWAWQRSVLFTQHEWYKRKKMFLTRTSHFFSIRLNKLLKDYKNVQMLMLWSSVIHYSILTIEKCTMVQFDMFLKKSFVFLYIIFLPTCLCEGKWSLSGQSSKWKCKYCQCTPTLNIIFYIWNYSSVLVSRKNNLHSDVHLETQSWEPGKSKCL